MIGRVRPSSPSSENQDPTPDPGCGQKWEFRSGPIVAGQIVIDDVDGEDVFYRTMSGNDPGSMKRSELVDTGEFVETVELRDS